MALQSTSTSGEYLTRTATVINHNSAYTAFMWVRLDSDANTYVHFIHIGGNPDAYDGNTDFIGTDADGTSLRWGVAGGSSNTFTAGAGLTVSGWYWIAMVRESVTSFKTYYGTNNTDGALLSTITSDVTSRASATAMRVLSYNGFGTVGTAAHARLWTRALTLTELHAEAASGTVVDATNIWSAADFDGANVADAALDDSGNSRDWTVTGTLDLVSGPSLGPSGPSITSLSDNTPTNGQSITITGTGFGATQGSGSVVVGGVTQTVTSWSDTSITITVVRGVNRYGTSLTLTVSDGTNSDTDSVTLQPDAGWAFVLLGTLGSTGVLVTSPALASGDGVHYETVGGDVVVYSDGTFSADPTVTEFDFEAWTPSLGWGSIATQTLTSGSSGTLARTNANDTSTATGSVTILATLARTNANDTSSASGNTTVIGTISRTNQNDTVVAVGTTTIQGTLAKTNQDDTMSATGSVGSSSTGSVDVTNQNDTSSANGSPVATGEASTTNNNDTLSATGSSGSAVSGTVNTTNQGDSSSASGTTTILGTIVVSEQRDVVVIAGTTIIVGSLTKTNNNDTVSATGSSGDPVAGGTSQLPLTGAGHT